MIIEMLQIHKYMIVKVAYNTYILYSQVGYSMYILLNTLDFGKRCSNSQIHDNKGGI